MSKNKLRITMHKKHREEVEKRIGVLQNRLLQLDATIAKLEAEDDDGE